jgi:PAS domain S-box-containing protein
MSEIIKKSTQQKLAECEVKSFQKDLGPFVVAAEMTRMPIVFTDAKEANNPIIFANDAFLSLSGYDRKEVLGQSFNFLMARGADRVALAQIKSAFEDSIEGTSEISYRRKDGTAVYLYLLVGAIHTGLRNGSGWNSSREIVLEIPASAFEATAAGLPSKILLTP